VLTEVPPSDHASKNIHEQSDIDEATLEPDVGNITDPDLINLTDLNVFEAIDPWMRPFNAGRRLTDTFDRHREVGFFHDPGDASMTDGVSLTQEELSNTSISIFWILQT